MSFRVELAVLSEQQSFCRFGLTLHNLSDKTLTNWQLQFIIDRLILADSFTHGDITQIGSLCTVKPDTHILNANQHYYCEFNINTYPFRFYINGLKDAVITTDDGKIKHAVTLTPIALASTYKERSELPQVDAKSIALIPKPNKIEWFEGEFKLTQTNQIAIQANLAEKAANWLQVELARLFNYKAQATGRNGIIYAKNPTLNEGEYQLIVNDSGVHIEANTHSGFVHASATLLQLIKPNHRHNLTIPHIKITDTPRFKYRGMMLDCARHFHSIDMVKRLINQLAHYKFNHFHWHLTDDEGWRLEIKALPKLTKIGAYRGFGTDLEPQYSHLADIYGGYYSQEEVKEVIAYAAERGINIIPEIDIPGHCRAAIKSLPEFLYDPNDRSQYLSIQNYNDNILSPALVGTYEFIDKVLEEVAELFPSPWIHIGADEVPDGVWLASPACQKLMQEEGYQNPKELQGHLLRYAEKKLHSLGKRMLGWEEAQHGNKVSKDTIIYSWLSEDAAFNCAKQGFDVILQPSQSTYLDLTQDYNPDEPGVDWAAILPLENAYHYEPLAHVPDGDLIRKRILGIQCALWSEIITEQKRMDYMIFPRITAVAEACWTEKSKRDWRDYLARLKGHLPLLDKQQINYRQPWK